MIDPELSGKVVLITGANNPHGIGAATARAFAAHRARVFLHYFRQKNAKAPPGEQPATSPGAAFYYAQQEKSADEVLADIRKMGGEAHAYEGDLSDPSLVPRLFDEAEHALGPVEILVNNAAYWEADSFVPVGAALSNPLVELWTDRPEAVTAARCERIFAVNARAAALMMAEFGRRHCRHAATWGRIVNLSTAGAECFPSEVTYAASKLALESYSRSAAVELARFGVNVNVLSLGPVQTGWITAELQRELLPTIPRGRLGRPEDVADVVVFLASEQARWITGQRIYVGGGHGM